MLEIKFIYHYLMEQNPEQERFENLEKDGPTYKHRNKAIYK